MYTLFYPENNMRATQTDYTTLENARKYFDDSYEELEKHKDIDLAAFLDTITGHVIVIREI